MRYVRVIGVLAAVAALHGASAQIPAADPSARLREVLPADVADRVVARIAAARARELPAEALENRALKFAAKGVAARDIEASVNEQADRMQQAKEAIERARGGQAAGDEIEAGAEVMRKGVDGAQVSELARSAPSGRSLAVPLYVIGNLVDRGLPSDDALARVRDKLSTRASDRELEDIPGSVAQGHRPAVTGQDLAATKRPATAGKPSTAGPPASVPRNPGQGGRRTTNPGQTKRP